MMFLMRERDELSALKRNILVAWEYVVLNDVLEVALKGDSSSGRER